MIHINLPIVKDYILNKDYNCIKVKHNSSIIVEEDTLNEAISHIKNDNLEKLKENDILIYFNNILEYRIDNDNELNEIINIKSINGNLLLYNSESYYCKYCNLYIEHTSYYYCYKCHICICTNCYDNLIYCKDNHTNKIMIRHQNTNSGITVYCDKCHGIIFEPIYYSKKVLDNSYDLCEDCQEKDYDQSLDKIQNTIFGENYSIFVF